MQVQIQPNWSDIAGTVLEVTQLSDVRGFGLVKIRVEKVKPVDGYKSMVDPEQHKELAVSVPVELITKLKIQAGDRITCRVRRADLKRTYVHREHISIERPNR